MEQLGFDSFFDEQLEPDERPRVARVTAEHRGAWEVQHTTGAAPARLTGRLRHEGDHPGVGDWVVLRHAPAPGDPALVERVLQRRTVFTRGAAGREAREQVIAANVDLVFVVCGLDGDFNVRRIERYLARIWASGAQPAVILSKADVCDDVASRVAEVERHAPGVEVLVSRQSTDSDGVLDPAALAAVRARIAPGATVAFVGSSGAGKSTLVNALLGVNRMTTGAVRAHDDRGQHVTTHRQLLALADGGVLIDTPGMRELQLVDGEGLDSVFDEVASLAAQCRFRDCRHESEPGCAVRAAADSGDLDRERLEHYRSLEREAAAFELRHDVHKRRQAERVWGALSDEVALLRRLKGGKP
jgi:ribosome biogenesis GTPase